METIDIKQSEHINSSEIMKINSKSKIAIASFIGTTIEYFDFYIYGISSALFIGKLFFPSEDPTLETIAAFLSFGVAYIARPIGSIVFGHFGDKLGRKTTLVTSLLCMGICTTLIGFLPTYEYMGMYAAILLCVLRFGQGFGLGGEWGGAALLATENAPIKKRAMYSMFPQLGPSIGFMLANLTYIALGASLSNEDMFTWGWRVPFIGSFILVAIGLYVRLSIIESPAFQKIQKTEKQAKVPIVELFKNNLKPLLLGTIISGTCTAVFINVSIFALQYKTTAYPWLEQPIMAKEIVLWLQIITIGFMTLAAPVTAYLCQKYDSKKVLLVSSIVTVIYGFFYGFGANSTNIYITIAFFAVGFFLVGCLFSPLSLILPEIYPTKVRYTGCSLAFNLSSIIGGGITPLITTYLLHAYTSNSVHFIGLFISIIVAMSIIAIYLLPDNTKHVDFMDY